jgi:hypothetical protein
MENETGMQIGTVAGAWADQRQIQPSKSFAPQPQPSAKTVEIIGKLGLRYPPANTVDRQAHAARIALLAEDCSDVPADCLEQAAREWAQTQPFMPKACELRENALAIARRASRAALPPPKPAEPPPPPPAPPLTDEEVKNLPGYLLRLGIKVGDIDPDRVERLLGEGQAA